MKIWEASNIENAKYLGPIEILVSEVRKRDSEGKYTGEIEKDCEYFELLQTEDRIVFGDACNRGFIESGYIEREEYESIDETLQELVADLKCYYRDGASYVSRIVCNERMW